MTTLDINEQKDAEIRASKLKVLLKKSANLWLEAATQVSDAKSNLGPNADSLFLTKAALTTAIADKLLRIAIQPVLYSDEMKPHISKLEGWSTLYEASKLKKQEMSNLLSALDKDKDLVLSRSVIQSFRSNNKIIAKANMIVAQITINEDDIKRLGYDQYIKFKNDLSEIERIIDRSYPAIGLAIKEKKLEVLENHFSEIDDVDTDDEPINHQIKHIECTDNNISVQ